MITTFGRERPENDKDMKSLSRFVIEEDALVVVTLRGSRMCYKKSSLKSSVAQILFSRRHLKETARYV